MHDRTLHFTMILIIEGATEKVPQVMIAVKTICNKNFCFISVFHLVNDKLKILASLNLRF